MLPGDNQFHVLARDINGQESTATIVVMGVSDGSTVSASGYSDVTSSFRPVYGRTSFATNRGELLVELATRNDGTFETDVPLLVGIKNITDPTVFVTGNDGVMPDGTPYFDFTDFVTGTTLEPGETSSAPTISFWNPNRIQFDYELVFFAKLNQAPFFESVPVVEAPYDQQYVYAAMAKDLDDDPVTFSLNLSPSGMQIDPVTGEVIWTPTVDQLGLHDVEIVASDDRGGLATQRYAIVVNEASPNRPPVITSRPRTVANAVFQPIQPVSATYAGIDFPLGDHSFADAIVDSELGTSSGSPHDNAANILGPPTNPNYSLGEGGWITVEFVNNRLVDQDGVAGGLDLFIFEGGGVVEDMQIEISADGDFWIDLGTIEGQPTGIDIKPYVDPGDSFRFVRVTDGSKKQTGWPYGGPDINAIGAIGSVLAYPTYEYRLNAIDPDFDALNYTLVNSPNGMVIDGLTGLIQWVPNADQIGNHSVTVEVSDGNGGIAIQEFVVCVHPDPNNHSPIIVSAPVTSVTQDPIVIGGFNVERGGRQVSLKEGELLNELRATLRSGIENVVFKESNTLSADFLETVDVLMISSVFEAGGTPIQPLTEIEQDNLIDFVENGRSALLFADNAAFASGNTSLLEPFGISIQQGTSATATVSNITHPIAAGPFGTVSNFEMFFSGAFSQLGSDISPIAGFGSNVGSALAVLEPGELGANSGGVAFFSDTSLLIDDIGIHGPIAPEAQKLVLNAIDLFVSESLYRRLGENLILNGDFEDGDSGFSSQLRSDLSPGDPGIYRIDTNPFNVYGGLNPDVGSFGDHTSGSGNMMVINGSDSALVNWEQTVDVEPDTEYEFSAWVATTFDVAPSELRLTINDESVATLTAPAVEGDWIQISGRWNSGDQQQATLQILNDQLAFLGNDFALDDIHFARIKSGDYEYQVDAIDPDNDDLTYSLVTGPSGMTINPVSGLVEWTPTDSALQFDGNDVVWIDDSPSLRPEDVTLEGWFRFDSAVGQQLLIDKHSGDSFFDSFALWYDNGTINGVISDNSGPGPFVTASFVPDVGRWYHFAYTFDDAADYQALYVNGDRVADGAVTKSIDYDSDPLLFGASYDFNSPHSFFLGSMDGVRIWEIPRTETEIQLSMSSRIGTAPGLISYFNFDEGTGNSVFDAVRGDRVGQLGAGFEVNSPSWIISTTPVGFNAVAIDSLGDRDFFGFGSGTLGDPVPAIEFDNRDPSDPAFTDFDARFGKTFRAQGLNDFSWTHDLTEELEVVQPETATLKLAIGGIQDDAVWDINDQLFLNAIETVGAFDNPGSGCNWHNSY